MTQSIWSILESILCIFEKNVHSIVGYSILLMSLRSSWFMVLLQLVFEVSKNGTIPNVTITGLASLTSAFAFVIPSAWNILPLGKIQFHFCTYVILSERPFLTTFPAQICFLSFDSPLFFYLQNMLLPKNTWYICLFFHSLIHCSIIQQVLRNYQASMWLWKSRNQSRSFDWKQIFESHLYRGKI